MSILAGVTDKRDYPVPEGQEFVLDDPNLPEHERRLKTLDNLSEAINLIEPEVFQQHVNEQKNDFSSWVENVFGEHELAEQLRKFPTPLRMMVSIEKFLRQTEASAQPAFQPEEVVGTAPEVAPEATPEATAMPDMPGPLENSQEPRTIPVTGEDSLP